MAQQQPEIRLSPREERFLKAFVRRQVLPLWGSGAVALAALLLALASTSWMRAEPVEPTPPQAEAASEAAGTAELEARWQARLEEAWQPRLDAARQGREELDRELSAVLSRVAKLEQRIAKSEQRVGRVENRFDEIRQPPPAAAAPATPRPAADPADLTTLIFNLEKRQDQVEAVREAFEKSILERMKATESLHVRRARESTETEKSLLNRLYNVEARLETLEQTR